MKFYGGLCTLVFSLGKFASPKIFLLLELEENFKQDSFSTPVSKPDWEEANSLNGLCIIIGEKEKKPIGTST